MKRAVGLAGGVVAAAAAVLLLLLALDIRGLHHRIAADDARLVAQPVSAHLWEPPQIVPGQAARRVLGIRRDLAYREGLRLLLLGRPWLNTTLFPREVGKDRNLAEVSLSRLAQSDPDNVRRSNELNMIGVLNMVTTSRADRTQRKSNLLRANLSFRDAIDADEHNDDAKYNLEIVLRLIQKQRVSVNTLQGLGGVATLSTRYGNGY
jgi:hypothetical protein